MTDTTITLNSVQRFWGHLDKAFLASLVILAAVAVFDSASFLPTVGFAAGAFGNTLPFIAFAVLAVGYLKATGAESLLAKAFEGAQWKMIILAALLGGLSPFALAK